MQASPARICLPCGLVNLQCTPAVILLSRQADSANAMLARLVRKSLLRRSSSQGHFYWMRRAEAGHIEARSVGASGQAKMEASERRSRCLNH